MELNILIVIAFIVLCFTVITLYSIYKGNRLQKLKIKFFSLTIETETKNQRKRADAPTSTQNKKHK